MTMLNLLVAFHGSASLQAALCYAAALARRQGAHVTALLAHSTHDTVDIRSRWIPERARALLAEAKSGLLQEIEARLDALRPELELGDVPPQGRFRTVCVCWTKSRSCRLAQRPRTTILRRIWRTTTLRRSLRIGRRVTPSRKPCLAIAPGTTHRCW